MYVHTYTQLLVLFSGERWLTHTSLFILFCLKLPIDTDIIPRSLAFKTKEMVHVTRIMMLNNLFFSSDLSSNEKIHFHMMKVGNNGFWLLFLFLLPIKKFLRKPFKELQDTHYTLVCIWNLAKNENLSPKPYNVLWPTSIYFTVSSVLSLYYITTV